MRYVKVAVSALLGFAIGGMAAVAALLTAVDLIRLYGDGNIVLFELASLAAFVVACVGGFVFLRASIRHNWEGERAMVPRYLMAFVSGGFAWFAFVFVAGLFAAVVTGAEEGAFILILDRVTRIWFELSGWLVALGNAWLTLRYLRRRDERRAAALSV